MENSCSLSANYNRFDSWLFDEAMHFWQSDKIHWYLSDKWVFHSDSKTPDKKLARFGKAKLKFNWSLSNRKSILWREQFAMICVKLNLPTNKIKKIDRTIMILLSNSCIIAFFVLRTLRFGIFDFFLHSLIFFSQFSH